ncbi:MAG: hypothetical protein RQ745_12425 [Longimicrobiales bacterium]|nr:hypothetical protein [Longimicrobiales bacterium]
MNGMDDRMQVDAAAADASVSARARGRVVERDQQISVISRVVTYLFGLVYSLLLIRIVLALLAASPATPFVGLIHSMARPFLAPFEGIGSSLMTSPEAQLIVPMIVAILVGVIVHAAILGLLRLFAPREIITQT